MLPRGSAMLKVKGVCPPSLLELPRYFITINMAHLSMLKTQHQKAFEPFMCVWKWVKWVFYFSLQASNNLQTAGICLG